MQKISGLSQPIDSELPLKRYFLCVGGALLTVLFAVDALMPRPRFGRHASSNPDPFRTQGTRGGHQRACDLERDQRQLPPRTINVHERFRVTSKNTWRFR